MVGRITEVASVGAGEESLRREKPDAIITDLRLPDGVGAEVVERLLRCAGEIPLLVLTSSTALEDAVAALKLGAKDFLVKNFQGDFTQLVELALRRLQQLWEAEAERRRLEIEMEKFRKAIERSDDGLATVASDGRLLYANQTFREFLTAVQGEFGRVEQVIGAGIERADEIRSNVQMTFQELAPGGFWQTEVRVPGETLRTFILSLVAIGSTEVGGSAQDAVLSIRDITEQKRREKFQREVLSTTTHDLRGPLGSVILSVELLEGMLAKESDAYKLATRMGSSIRNVLQLIDEFLSARRIQEGTLTLHPKTFPLREAVSDVLRDFASMAEARGITLVTDVPEELLIVADRLGVGRVLSNLLSNALKFTPRGGVVTLRGVSGEGEVRIAVIDTGAGMEEEEVAKLFQRFSRLKRHEDVAGTGLGLFVVKSMVSAHGGRVDVRSAPGRGTVFEAVFPLNPPVDARGELISFGE